VASLSHWSFPPFLPPFLPPSFTQASIEKALVEMERLNLKGNTAGVYFGQLLGTARREEGKEI